MQLVCSTTFKGRPYRLGSSAFRRLMLLLCVFAIPAYAQQGGNSPWENAVNVLKTAFTGTIATGLSLVAIVIGGLMFAFGGRPE